MHLNLKIKKVIFFILVLLGYVYSPNSVALSMGDIQVKSALGQTLLAQVKVNDTDSSIDESCFNVTTEDPENGVMLKYSPSDALITIQSQHPVAKPAMVLSLFNHCQAPSKRHYIFFVNAQEQRANSQNSKNETPPKILGDQFHYQRIFNKLTKQTEQELNAKGLPDRFIYEDQTRDSRLNGKTEPITTESISTDNSLSVKESTARVASVRDKPNKSIKSTDKINSKVLKNGSIEPNTESNKPSSVVPQVKPQSTPTKPAVENKLALAKTISTPLSKPSNTKTPVSKTLDSKTNETQTKPTINTSALSTSETESTISAENIHDLNNEHDLISAEDNPPIFEEQLLAEKRMLELQTQLNELYNINSSLDNLFKEMKLELTQVKKENDFLRSLTLCLGVTLLLSSYFFADWLRRKKSQPIYEREPSTWTSQDLPVQPPVQTSVTENQFAASGNATFSENTTTSSEGNAFSEAGFVTMSQAKPIGNVSELNTQNSIYSISDIKASLSSGLNLNNVLSQNQALVDEPVSTPTEQVRPTTPKDISTPIDLSSTPVQQTNPSPPLLTITRPPKPIKPELETQNLNEAHKNQDGSASISSSLTASPALEDGTVTSAQQTTPTHAAIIEASKLQPAGVMDDVDVFLSHGRTNLAIQLLQNYLMEHPKESAVIWIFLLDLLAKEGKRREYEITTEECRKHFNIKLSDFSVPVANNDSIESFERISAALQKVWGTPLVLSFIDELIYNTRLVPRIGFNRAIFEELMLLRELAEEELRMDQTQIQPTPASMTHRQVSDEFKQLAEDLKTQDQRQQDVNQYLSQFEFNLEDLSK